MDWDDDRKTKEAVGDAKESKYKAKDSREGNKRLKREKICQKPLSKAEKKACLEVKEVDDNKKADDNKNTDDDKDASFFASAFAIFLGLPTPIIAFLGPPTPVAASLGLFAPVAAFSNLSTCGFVNPSPASATGTSITVCPSFLSFFIRSFLFFFPTHHTTPISPSPMQVLRSTSLLLEDDYAIQRSISPLRISRKQSQQDIVKDNKKKLREQTIAAQKQKETVWFLLCSCLCTSAVKLNSE